MSLKIRPATHMRFGWAFFLHQPKAHTLKRGRFPLSFFCLQQASSGGARNPTEPGRRMGTLGPHLAHGIESCVPHIYIYIYISADIVRRVGYLLEDRG